MFEFQILSISSADSDIQIVIVDSPVSKSHGHIFLDWRKAFNIILDEWLPVHCWPHRRGWRRRTSRPWRGRWPRRCRCPRGRKWGRKSRTWSRTSVSRSLALTSGSCWMRSPRSRSRCIGCLETWDCGTVWMWASNKPTQSYAGNKSYGPVIRGRSSPCESQVPKSYRPPFIHNTANIFIIIS